MKLLKLLRHRLRQPFDELDYMARHVNLTARLAEELDTLGLLPVDDGFSRFKQTNTLFVLASGPSINSLRDQDWDHIRSLDSIGFNTFLVHQFVPSLYCMQYNAAVATLLSSMSDRFRDVPIIFRGQKMKTDFFREAGLDPADFSQGLFYLREIPVSSRSSVEPAALYDWFENLGFLTKGRVAAWTPKLRSTLVLMVLFAYQLGYDKVVLCGADMTDASHFWDDPDARLLPDVSFSYPGPDKNMLAFSDPAFHPNTIPRYLADFQAWAQTRSEFRIFTGSAKSALAAVLPVYDWPGASA